MHGLVHWVQDVLYNGEACQVIWATIAPFGYCRFRRSPLLTLGFLGRHDHLLPFHVQGSTVAPLNSYPFLDLWYLSSDVIFNKTTQVGDAPGHDSRLTVCIDVKKRRSCAD